MADSTLVKMGVCNVEFDAADLGYTSGGVKVNFGSESVEVKVDQEAVPVDEVLTNQSLTIEVPLAEYDLDRFATVLPDATLVVDGVDANKKKLELGGSGGISLQAMAKKLVIKPENGDMYNVTVPAAIPVPNLEFSYEKENVRVYTITFKALKTSGEPLFIMGDETATA